MDEEEKSILEDFEIGATYALVNATEPDTDPRREPGSTEDDDLETQLPSSPSQAEQGMTSLQTSPTQPHSNYIIEDQHREYPHPSLPPPETDTSASVFHTSSNISTSSQRPIKSSMAPACHYGTFGDHKKKRPNLKGRRVVTFELSEEQEEGMHRSRGTKYSDFESAIKKDWNIEYGGERDIRIDDACLLTKEDVDHMCDDTSERVRYRPNASHWQQILCAALLLCPICGIVSAIFAYKSKRYYDTGQKELAKQMLRHSDFCLRCATIFGIIFWFLVFLLLVVNKEKLV